MTERECPFLGGQAVTPDDPPTSIPVEGGRFTLKHGSPLETPDPSARCQAQGAFDSSARRVLGRGIPPNSFEVEIRPCARCGLYATTKMEKIPPRNLPGIGSPKSPSGNG